MLAEELPESEFMICSSQKDELAKALRQALEGSRSVGYGHMTPIFGRLNSGRVVSPRSFMDTVKLPKVILPMEMAMEFVDQLRWQARYDPTENPRKIKGWELRKAVTDDGPIVIAWAAWVSAPDPVMPVFF